MSEKPESAQSKLTLLQRINAIRRGIAYIQKDRSVSTGSGSYKAVTHDAVTAMVRPGMIEHGVVCIPTLAESTSQPYEVNADMTRAKQFRYEATYNFAFCNIDDPEDKLVIRIQAHAMDNADKAPGKALSYAKKYAVLKLFEIETGEDEESRYKDEGMDENDLVEYLKNIEGANTQDALKQAFMDAYTAAKEAKDKDAAKTLIAAKDSRKAVLLAGSK